MRSNLYWKLATVSLILVVLFSAAAAGMVLTHAPARPVAAQDDQPADTTDLFVPFWEAWDLLHSNYVDPLDDNALAQGALDGLVSAVDDPAFDLELPPLNEDAADTAQRFEPFWEAWDLIHDEYAGLDDNALMEGALIGMIASIGDPHTDYMPPDIFARVNEGMSGEYEGIGATVRQNEETGGLELLSLIEDSPAERAGLMVGDQIVRVEGQDVTTWTQNEIIAQVRGPAGTPVRLGILRPGEAEILKYEVVRDRINVSSVTSRILEGDIGYVRLSQFEFNTSSQMRQALETMDVENLNGLILDMRGNPGGYLTTAVEVGSAFLQSGNILIERSPGMEFPHPAQGNAIAVEVPMVVLVDQGSASASELVAGALQDYERATIVGMPTFGKGSVQTWRELSNGGGVRITISRWYTPNGRSVSEVGIHPDVEVPFEPESISGDEDNQLTAAVQVLNGTYEPAATAEGETVPAVE